MQAIRQAEVDRAQKLFIETHYQDVSAFKDFRAIGEKLDNLTRTFQNKRTHTAFYYGATMLAIEIGDSFARQNENRKQKVDYSLLTPFFSNVYDEFEYLVFEQKSFFILSFNQYSSWDPYGGTAKANLMSHFRDCINDYSTDLDLKEAVDFFANNKLFLHYIAWVTTYTTAEPQLDSSLLIKKYYSAWKQCSAEDSKFSSLPLEWRFEMASQLVGSE